MRLPFTIDLGRAAFSLALAVLLYFVALSETNPESRNYTSYTVPVQVVNVPPGLVVTNPPPEVHVWVRAPLNVFNRLRRESFTAQVDASSAHPGDNIGWPITVTSSDPDVRSTDPDPPAVNLNLEDIRKQSLPVRVNLIGQPPTGYTAGQPVADPPGVTVEGASSQVSRAVEAVVDVPVDRVTVSINGVFTPRVVDDRGNDLRDLNLRLTPPSISVQVPITQQTQYKEVGVRAVTTGTPAAGYVLEPLEVNPATATLRGSAADLETVNFVETQPIDITGISTSVVRPVPLVQPARTLLLQPGQTVTVTARVSALTVSQTVRVPPSVINLSGNVQLVRTPDPVAVTISGPAPALATLALNPRDFRVILDVGGKAAGRWDIDAKVQGVPTGLQVDSVVPPRVTVELRSAPPPPTPTPTPG